MAGRGLNGYMQGAKDKLEKSFNVIQTGTKIILFFIWPT
jgi:hypothetical protein